MLVSLTIIEKFIEYSKLSRENWRKTRVKSWDRNNFLQDTNWGAKIGNFLFYNSIYIPLYLVAENPTQALPVGRYCISSLWLLYQSTTDPTVYMQKCVLLQIWRLEIQGQGVSLWIPSLGCKGSICHRPLFLWFIDDLLGGHLITRIHMLKS